MNHRHVRPLVRFWWLLVIGIGVGLIAGVAAVAHISLSAPPKVTYRAKAKYTATEMVLVTSKTNPIVRTSVTGSLHAVKAPKVSGKNSQQTTTSTSSPSVVASPAPPQSDINTLVYDANLYPHLITSDPVLALRLRMFGDLRGTVVAKAVNSVTTASGKYKPGNVPIIQLDATAGRPDRAIKLATSTVTAFATWLTRNQAASVVPPGQRVLVVALDTPKTAIASGGPRTVITVLVAFAVLAAFIGLAFIFDKIPPRETAAVATSTVAVGENTYVHGNAQNVAEPPANGSTPSVDAPAKRRAARDQVGSTDAEELATSLTQELSPSRAADGRTGTLPSPKVDA